MHITADSRQGGKFVFYNLNLASAPGKEPFMTIKGCRIIEGQKGPFISFPAQKDDKDKYWPHVWASDGFQVEAIKAMRAATPKQDTRTHGEQRKAPPLSDMESEIPF